MKASHLLTIGAAATLAVTANAAILVLDDFSVEPLTITRNSVGTDDDYRTSAQGFVSHMYVEMVSSVAGDPVTTGSAAIGDLLNFYNSKSSDGKLKLVYGDYNDALNPALNLDRSYYGLAGGIGVYLEGWDSDVQVPLTVTIYSGIDSGSFANFYQYDTILPIGTLAELIIDGDAFTGSGGTFDLTDVDSVVYEFTVANAGDFFVDALGIPEPHEYAVVAGLGLLGFAAFRRLQRKS